MKTAADRFWAKVRGGDVADCWVWMASVYGGGYGEFFVDDLRGRMPAHRWSYESMRDEIPSGLQLDHLCRNRACVNPWHLEPVTHLENNRRGEKANRTHCPQGHPYDETNTYVSPRRGDRQCRTCMRERNFRAWKALQARARSNRTTIRQERDRRP